MKDAYSDRPSEKDSRRMAPADQVADRPRGLAPAKGRGKLGSLAQAARIKKLNEARNILLFVGLLTIAFNAVFLALARDNVKKELENEIAKAGGRGNVQIDPVKLQEAEDHAVLIVTLVNGAAIVLGVLFVVFGLIVKRFPAPVTILSLVLYVGAILGFAMIEPSTLAGGLLIKIIVIVCLAKAIQAALAYEKEQRRATELEAAG
jgi:hypothetical protein